MGSYNKSGFLSHLPIRYHDKTMALICLVNSTDETDYQKSPYYVDSQLMPFCLPIYGEYDDYGSLQNIESNYTTKLFEKACNAKIKDILTCIIKNISEFYPTATEAINNLKEYNHSESESDYQILLNIKSFIDDGILCRRCNKLVVLFEHTDFFLDCCNSDSHYKSNILKSLESNIDILDKYQALSGDKLPVGTIVENDLSSHLKIHAYSVLHNVIKSNQSKCDQLLTLANEIDEAPHYFFNWRYILPFYTVIGSDYKNVETEEIANLSALDHYMRHIHEYLTVPGEWGQDDDMNAKKEHWQKCIDYIKILEERHEW